MRMLSTVGARYTAVYQSTYAEHSRCSVYSCLSKYLCRYLYLRVCRYKLFYYINLILETLLADRIHKPVDKIYDKICERPTNNTGIK